MTKVTNNFCCSQCHIKQEKQSLVLPDTQYLQGKNRDRDRHFFFFLLSPISLSPLSSSKAEIAEHTK